MHGPARAAEPLPDGLISVLRCPSCRRSLSGSSTAFECTGCATRYDASGGALDLRLRAPKDYVITYRVGEEPLRNDELPFVPLVPKSEPEVDFTGTPVPGNLDRSILSHFPAARSTESLALDLGCGTGVHRQVCERAGYQWVGLDWDERGALIWGDGHSLPFADDSFEFIVSVAVLEHLRHPVVAMTEALRVLEPGGTLLGTVAFGEPFHQDSHYHHTHLGTLNTLRQAGFEVSIVAPHADWTVLRAQAQMGLFPKMPARVARLLVAPLEGLHRLWWAVGKAVSRNPSSVSRVRNTTGAFTFVARKPTRA